MKIDHSSRLLGILRLHREESVGSAGVVERMKSARQKKLFCREAPRAAAARG